MTHRPAAPGSAFRLDSYVSQIPLPRPYINQFNVSESKAAKKAAADEKALRIESHMTVGAQPRMSARV